MQTALLVAKILSAVALLALTAALVNLWRRGEVPVFAYGSITLAQRRLKAVWLAFLVGALAVGSSNDPVVQFTEDRVDPASSLTESGRLVTQSLTLPLPFYRFERTRRTANGIVVEEHVLEGVVLPWAFLWALLAYYVLVVRWNPDSRWARRVLEGRRKSREAGMAAELSNGPGTFSPRSGP